MGPTEHSIMRYGLGGSFSPLGASMSPRQTGVSFGGSPEDQRGLPIGGGTAPTPSSQPQQWLPIGQGRFAPQPSSQPQQSGRTDRIFGAATQAVRGARTGAPTPSQAQPGNRVFDAAVDAVRNARAPQQPTYSPIGGSEPPAMGPAFDPNSTYSVLGGGGPSMVVGSPFFGGMSDPFAFAGQQQAPASVGRATFSGGNPWG